MQCLHGWSQPLSSTHQSLALHTELFNISQLHTHLIKYQHVISAQVPINPYRKYPAPDHGQPPAEKGSDGLRIAAQTPLGLGELSALLPRGLHRELKQLKNQISELARLMDKAFI